MLNTSTRLIDSMTEVNEIRTTPVQSKNRRYRNKPPRGKTNNVVSEQVRHKPACTSTEKS